MVMLPYRRDVYFSTHKTPEPGTSWTSTAASQLCPYEYPWCDGDRQCSTCALSVVEDHNCKLKEEASCDQVEVSYAHRTIRTTIRRGCQCSDRLWQYRPMWLLRSRPLTQYRRVLGIPTTCEDPGRAHSLYDEFHGSIRSPLSHLQ